MTYEDFIDKYLDHIEGRASRDSRPYTAETSLSQKEREATPPKGKPKGGKVEEKKAEAGGAEEEENQEEEEEEKDDKHLSANQSRVTIHTTKSEKEARKQRKKDAQVKRFSLEDGCKSTILKKNLIEILSKKFVLVVHP